MHLALDYTQQNYSSITVVVAETCVTERKKEVQIGESEEEEEEEEPHLYRQELTGIDATLAGSVVVEDSGTDNSDDEEKELCVLVQRLHGSLVSTPIGKCTGSVAYLNWFSALNCCLIFQCAFFCKGRHVVHIRLSHCYSQQEGLEIQCFILLLLSNQLETGVRKQWSARQSLLPVSKFIFPTTKQEPFSFSLEISVKNSGFCSSHRRLTLSIGICCLSSLVIACSHTSHTNGPVLCL